MKYFPILLGLSSALLLSGCTMTTANSSVKPAPQTFVLVHGALLGEFSWNRVSQQLAADGNKVITLDLPGHGADQTSPEGLTLNTYRDAVIKAIGSNTNVVLVGHSFGGMVISQVAEAVPSKISKLVYLAALIPQSGESAGALSGMDKDSLFGKYVAPTVSTLTFNPAGIQPVFCNDCSADDVTMVKAKLRPEPAAPFGDPVTLTVANYGSVRKYNIMTRQDQALSYGFQQTMNARGTFIKSTTLNTSHLPFFSQPAVVAQVLENL